MVRLLISEVRLDCVIFGTYVEQSLRQRDSLEVNFMVHSFQRCENCSDCSKPTEPSNAAQSTHLQPYLHLKVAWYLSARWQIARQQEGVIGS